MNKLFTNSNKIYVLIYVGVCLLIFPLLVNADSSFIYNEVITSSNSSVQNNSNGDTSIEISNTTIINGERSSYNYSTTTTGSVNNRLIIEQNQSDTPTLISEIVTIETNLPVINKSVINTPISKVDLKLMLPQASTTSTTKVSPYSWSQIESVLNYLYFYVDKLF